MKARLGFVSNSSVSSFLIVGAFVDLEDIKKIDKIRETIVKERAEVDDRGEDMEIDDCFDYYDIYEIREVVQEVFECNAYSYGYDAIAVGIEPGDTLASITVAFQKAEEVLKKMGINGEPRLLDWAESNY